MSADVSILTVMFFQDDCWLMKTDSALTTHKTIGPLRYDNPHTTTPHNYRLTGKGLTGLLSPQSTWKTITVSLPKLQIVTGIDWWPYDLSWIPPSWHVDVSLDGHSYESALMVDQFQSNHSTGYLISAPWRRGRGDTGLLPLQTQYLRFAFDEAAPQDDLRQWAVEIRLQSSY